MKTILKWIGIVLGAVVGLLLLAGIFLYLRGSSILNKTYSIPVEPITIPTDAASLQRGQHLAEVICADCHGNDYSGVASWFSSGPLGSIDSANLTSGEGGVGRRFQSTEDYVRAVRHGVDPSGKPIYMPAVLSLNHMSDEDLGAVIAYLKRLPPVDHVVRGNETLTPLALIMIGAGQFTMQADQVDHANLHPTAPPAAVSAEYGQYLVTINHCDECHGQQLSGGTYPDPSVTAPGPNLTPGGELAAWKEADFVQALRSGTTPSGRTLKSYMPWKAFGRMSDDELSAIWMYLQSLPAMATTTR